MPWQPCSALGVSTLGLKQIKVDVNELAVGMFVSGLDRPWTQTPFPLQGFYIRSADDIKALKVHCKHVYIDAVKGPGPTTSLRRLTGEKRGSVKPARAGRNAALPDVAPLKIRRDTYV